MQVKNLSEVEGVVTIDEVGEVDADLLICVEVVVGIANDDTVDVDDAETGVDVVRASVCFWGVWVFAVAPPFIFLQNNNNDKNNEKRYKASTVRILEQKSSNEMHRTIK